MNDFGPFGEICQKVVQLPKTQGYRSLDSAAIFTKKLFKLVASVVRSKKGFFCQCSHPKQAGHGAQCKGPGVLKRPRPNIEVLS